MATSASPPSRPELKSVRGGSEGEEEGREGVIVNRLWLYCIYIATIITLIFYTK